MKTDKSCFINHIQDGQPVKGLYLVKEMGRAETKAGKPYLMLTVMDATGEMAGRVWENADQLLAECPVGAIISLTGQAQAYKGVLQLKIDSIKSIDPATVDMADFMPSTTGDIKAMAKEIVKIANEVENPHLRELLLAFFKNKKFLAQFKKAPAAKAMHHAYVGGLLEHTLAVAHLARQVCDLYPAIDRSLLIAGALLHDIGKMKEFDFDNIPPDYSDQGRLVGHMVLGVEMVQECIAKIKNFPPELATGLKHLVLSHHGRYEFGSPTLPMMQEAFVLNFLDDLDAKINYMGRLADRVEGDGYQWSEYQRNLERFLFVKGHQMNENSPIEQSQKNDVDSRQRNLFGF